MLNYPVSLSKLQDLSASGCFYRRSRSTGSQHHCLGYENVFAGVVHTERKNLPHSKCELFYKPWLLFFSPQTIVANITVHFKWKADAPAY